MITTEEEQIALSKQFLRARCNHRKSINYRVGTYGLKHAVESWVKSQTGDTPYVSQDSFIKAAEEEGYIKQKIRHVESSKYRLNISVKNRKKKDNG